MQVNRNGKCLLQRYQDDSSNSDNQLVLGALVGFYGSGDFFNKEHAAANQRSVYKRRRKTK